MSRIRAFLDSNRLRKLLIGAGVILIFALLGLIVYQDGNHHASTSKELSAIISAQADHAKTLNEVAKLQQQVVGIVAEIPAVKAGLTTGQNQLIAELSWIECAVATSASKCGPIPGT